jgi:hypothetical protein
MEVEGGCVAMQIVQQEETSNDCLMRFKALETRASLSPLSCSHNKYARESIPSIPGIFVQLTATRDRL